MIFPDDEAFMEVNEETFTWQPQTDPDPVYDALELEDGKIQLTAGELSFNISLEFKEDLGVGIYMVNGKYLVQFKG